ncbi:MAG: ankyrin repeat domain-containing protein [Myxococcales bacterium]|nr:ankyrin repeat domain-containing protein [Myxococcales bacterium]
MSPTERLRAQLEADVIDDAEVLAAARAGADLALTGWFGGMAFLGELSLLMTLALKAPPTSRMAVISALVELGAEVDVASPKYGYTALHFAARANDVPLCRLLLDHGADPNAICTNSVIGSPLWACLRRSARPGDPDLASLVTLELLLERGADVDLVCQHGKTAVYRALDLSSPALLERLLRQGPTLDRWLGEDQAFGDTAFCHAIAVWPEILPSLVDAGADPDGPGPRGRGCLWYPVFTGQLQLVDTLLALGAEIDTRDAHGRTVLFRRIDFSRQCDVAIIEGLLQRGANANTRSDDGRTVLHAATQRGEVEVVRTLLAHGADPAAQDTQGATPLDLAAGPLLRAVLGGPITVMDGRLTDLAIDFLRDGLLLDAGDWQLLADDGELRERGAVKTGRRSVSPAYVRELVGWLLLHGDAHPHARTATLTWLAEGMRRAGLGDLLPHVASLDAATTYLRVSERVLAERLALELTPSDGARLLAAAVAAGMQMSYGDKESWWSVHFESDRAAFVCKAGSHFGPEGARDDALTKDQFIARWRSRWSLNRGRLEGHHRQWLDQALAYFDIETLRQWLEQNAA